MAGLVCLVVAIICFVVAALGVGSKLGVDIVDIGLALFAASFLFGGRPTITP